MPIFDITADREREKPAVPEDTPTKAKAEEPEGI
jgi:hypothetical protein